MSETASNSEIRPRRFILRLIVVVPLTIVFGALQVPLLKRYTVEPAE